MNVELLEKVRQHILEEPKRLDMSAFVLRKSDGPAGVKYPKCGTVGCIAGWAVMLNGCPNVEYGNVRPMALKAIGITQKEADKLFYPDNWPNDFAARYGVADFQSQEAANLTAEVIDDFIATYGK